FRSHASTRMPAQARRPELLELRPELLPVSQPQFAAFPVLLLHFLARRGPQAPKRQQLLPPARASRSRCLAKLCRQPSRARLSERHLASPALPALLFPIQA